MSLRSNVLRAYRECVALARILPSQQCEKVLDEVRTGIRKHTDLPEGSAATDQLKALVARVSFLRLSTPRSSLPSRSRLGHTHYVFRDGELVEGKGFAETKLGDGKVGMDEGFRKHRQLMKRQYFGRDPPRRPGIF